jgi:SAM-dependent methyltransferase
VNLRNFLPGALLFRIRRECFAPPDEFDRQYGIETRLPVCRMRLRSNSDSSDYEAIHPALFDRALPYVPRHTFIDLGCGKGRALVLAHRAGFQDLIGVELSPRLARAASRNARKLGISPRIVSADAALFEFPDRPFVLFLFNPFGSPTMQSVLNQLNRTRHPVHVIYINPIHQSLFTGFRALYSDHTMSVLTNSPPARPS